MQTDRPALEASALHILRLIARQPWRHYATSLRSAHWLASSLKLAARSPVSGCWPSCTYTYRTRITLFFSTTSVQYAYFVPEVRYGRSPLGGVVWYDHVSLRVGYNPVWSVLCECNEHNTLQTVLQPTYFMTTHQMAIDTQAYYRAVTRETETKQTDSKHRTKP